MTDARSARAAAAGQPSLIKRPVVDWGGTAGLTVGFDAGGLGAARTRA